MIHREERAEFNKLAIAQGWRVPTDVPQAHVEKFGPMLVERWLKALAKSAKTAKYVENPRLVQRFTIGADPEFVLSDGHALFPGNQLGLKTAKAYGVDSNGRLIELRPEPSRSALHVTAGLLLTLRWMSILVPQSLTFDWYAGAFKFADGLGGHVHVGRLKGLTKVRDWFYVGQSEKKPVPEAIEGLDMMMTLLTTAGTYPDVECALRAKGDQFGQRYGRPSDVRLQKYGYEYRTFPSWLDSPLAAMLSLTLSKLVVFDPSVAQPVKLTGRMTAKQAQHRVMNLLGKWRGLDDDARICLLAIEKWGFPRFLDGDFKGRWGISAETLKGVQPGKVDVLPNCFHPEEDIKKELFCHLTNHANLGFTAPKINWKHTLPKGYYMPLAGFDTTRLPGYGEILADIVAHESMKVGFRNSESGRQVGVSLGLAAHTKGIPGWEAKMKAFFPRNPDEVHAALTPRTSLDVSIGSTARTGPWARVTKKFLTSGLLPLWTVDSVKEGSFEEWQKVAQGSKKERYVTKIVKGG